MPAHQDPKTDEEIECLLTLLGIKLQCPADMFWIDCSGMHPVEEWVVRENFRSEAFIGWSSRHEAYNDIMKYLYAHSRGEIKDEPWWTSAQS